MESLLATEHEFDLFLLLLALALEEAPAAAKDTFWDWRCEKRTNVNFFLIAPPILLDFVLLI